MLMRKGESDMRRAASDASTSCGQAGAVGVARERQEGSRAVCARAVANAGDLHQGGGVLRQFPAIPDAYANI